ncbi:MAG: alpha/beta hydrolase [Oscillospiraceae bacterium]
MKKFEPIKTCNYGPLNPKVILEPDFFTGFDNTRRKEIVTKEAEFYHSITAPFSVSNKIQQSYIYVEATDGYKIPVKVYRPKNCDEKIPAMLFLHGGGFITCSPETHDYVPAYIAANAGVACFNVDYRLAPEHKFPTGIEDCCCVADWINSKAEELKLDANKLCIGGDSSGGNFAAVITHIAKDEGNLRFWKQVLIYPATDFSGNIPKKSAAVYAMPGTSDGESSSPSFLDQYLSTPEDRNNPRVSPLLRNDLKDLPEALFIQAECDALCDDGLYYAKALSDAGVPVQCEIYKGMPHAFILRTYEETFAALDRICSFLRD